MSGVASIPTVLVEAVCRLDALVRAVLAVVPHVGAEKAGVGLERVRMVIDQRAMRVAFVATNGMSAAVASVLCEEMDVGDGDGELFVEMDFTAQAVRLIGSVHSMKRAEAEAARARITVDEHAQALEVTDVTGLWPGRSVRVRAQSEWFSEEGLDRADGAGKVFQAAIGCIAADASFCMSPDSLRAWTATAKQLDGLPVVATVDGDLVIAHGDAQSPFLFVGCTEVWGVHNSEAFVHDTAVSPDVAGVLAGLVIGSEAQAPAGGPSPTGEEVDVDLVADLSAWLHEQDDVTTGSEDRGPWGGDAA